MEIKIRDMYSYLLSHTFPGFLLGIEILIELQVFANVNVSGVISKIYLSNTSTILILTVGAYVVSTMIGIILDGIHHFLFDDIGQLIKKFTQKEEPIDNNFNIYDCISDPICYKLYKDLDDDYWYPGEAYANISIAMLPGFHLFVYWLLFMQKLNIFSISFILPALCYLIVLAITTCEAFTARHLFNEYEQNIIKAFCRKKDQIVKE